MIQDGVRIAEDDARRSAHVWHLLGADASHEGTPPAQLIPRVVVQYWHDLAELPADVAECIDTWTPLIERGFRRVLFDDATARAFIASLLGRTYVAAFDRCSHPAMRCDYFRLCWMLFRGGFYVDADECYLGGICDGVFTDGRLKVQPLCYDLSTESMVPASAFLNNEEPSTERIYYVNNNPLIAPPGHPVMRMALDRATRLLLRAESSRDIQATTGPGNLTASLVQHSIDREDSEPRDFTFLFEWDAISTSRWPLSYRADERNWRVWSSAR